MITMTQKTFIYSAFLALFMIFSASNGYAADKISTGFFSSKAVSGYDTVSYFTEGKPVKGKSEFSTEYMGATWLFSSQANLDLFKGNPTKYAPQYGGYCAYAAAQNALASSDPHAWDIVDGKLYLNYNKSVQKDWRKDIPGYISKADKNFPNLVK